MPRLPKVRCKTKNCIELVEPPKRYCIEHQRESYRREKTIYTQDPFYHSKEWIACRTAHRIAYPFCKQCEREGAVTDHIIPRSQGGEDFNWSNLQTLCRSCDQIKRGKESAQKRSGSGSLRGIC